MARKFAIWMLAAAVVAAPTAAEEFDPFHMPKEHFSNSVKTIAFAPMLLPPATADANIVRKRLEEILRVQLETRGYDIIGSEVFGERWEGFSEKLGGVFDPVTGDTREEVWKTAFEYTTRELEREHGVDAVIFPSVIIASLAVWGKQFGFFAEAFEAANFEPLTWDGAPLTERPQLVLGTHLSILIRNPAGDSMYGVKFPIEVTSVYAKSGYREKPESALYGNEGSIHRAVANVLDKLPRREGPRRVPTRPPSADQEPSNEAQIPGVH